MAVRISWASSYGTMIIYFMAPLIITLLSWRMVFLFSALCGIVMLFFWNRYCIDIPAPPEGTKKHVSSSTNATNVLFSPVMIGIMIAIILQGMLRDGVATWMPSYIADTYQLGTSVSILTGVALPVFSILCTQTTSVLYRKKLKVL